jgi:hypothetical protein
VTTCGCFLNVVTPLAPLSPEEAEKMGAAILRTVRQQGMDVSGAELAVAAFERLRKLRSAA